jgi:hypothetical protein
MAPSAPWPAGDALIGSAPPAPSGPEPPRHADRTVPFLFTLRLDDAAAHGWTVRAAGAGSSTV